MTRYSQSNGHSTDFRGDWTEHKGHPVYWLAPEFWSPATGIIRLLLPDEEPGKISSREFRKRIIEFHILQGDPRYCSPKEADRMRRVMVERLGTDTPWRGLPPQNTTSGSARAA